MEDEQRPGAQHDASCALVHSSSCVVVLVMDRVRVVAISRNTKRFKSRRHRLHRTFQRQTPTPVCVIGVYSRIDPTEAADYPKEEKKWGVTLPKRQPLTAERRMEMRNERTREGAGFTASAGLCGERDGFMGHGVQRDGGR